MALIKQLLTGRGSGLPLKVIESQQLAVAKAWQVLEHYPTKGESKKAWSIYKDLRGVMLADEVGGGKTFEALAIISKALLEKKRKQFRVLMIAAPAIQSKWKWHEEIKEECSDIPLICEIDKFIKQTIITNKSSLKKFFSEQHQIKSKKEWQTIVKSNEGKRQGIWLSSFQSLPKTDNKGAKSKFSKANGFPQGFFDLIVVDEAHALKSGSKDAEETTRLSAVSIGKIYSILNAKKKFGVNKKIKLILLTATPFQNNKNEFTFLLSLLEKVEKKHAGITGKIAQGINKLDKEFRELTPEKITLTSIKKLKYHFDHDINQLLALENDEKIFRPFKALKSTNGLDDFMSDIIIRNSKKILPIEQEPAFLGEPEKLQYLLLRNLVNTDEEQQMFSTKLCQFVSSDKSFSKRGISKLLYNAIIKLFNGNLIYALKVNKLLEIIDSLNITNGKNVITIFISWIPTLETLQEQIIKFYGKQNVYVLKGDQKQNERVEILNKIKKANEVKHNKLFLLASRVGNEGLDFDNFSNTIIHYDNNYNPAIIDQRNGRIYRGSNLKRSTRKTIEGKDIKVYQIYLEDTYDQRILFIEAEKRRMKNFFLGDGSLNEVLSKILKKNNILDKEKIIKVLENIKIDFVPNRNQILSKYKKELIKQ